MGILLQKVFASVTEPWLVFFNVLCVKISSIAGRMHHHQAEVAHGEGIILFALFGQAYVASPLIFILFINMQHNLIVFLPQLLQVSLLIVVGLLILGLAHGVWRL
jgi:hypothetical protein